MLSVNSVNSSSAFNSIFVVIWAGASAVTLNAQLLGGKMSFFQSVCVLGYCICPLNVACLLCLFFSNVLLRSLFVMAAIGWAVFGFSHDLIFLSELISFVAAVGFLTEPRLSSRKALAVYPIFLFYIILGWIILVSS